MNEYVLLKMVIFQCHVSFQGGMYNMIVPIGNNIGMTNGQWLDVCWKIRYIKYISLPFSPINPLGNEAVFFPG